MPESKEARTYTSDEVKRFREYYREEVDGAALYRLLADAEKDPHLKEVYVRLAASEERHIALWETKLRDAGAEIPRGGPSLRVRALGWLARRFGTPVVAPIVTRFEQSATTMYDGVPDAMEHNLPADERSHARLFNEISRRPGEARAGVDIARLEGRHRSGSGNALRAAVLGVNDGLVSNLALVMGVAGASPGRDVVLLSGVAGLLAGSFSMALGEWVSVRSSVESFQRQMSIEAEELALMPEEEMEELTLIYQAKGLSEENARATATRILANPATALDTLVREELGLSEGEAGNAGVAAFTSFLTFTVGAAVPVIPWLFVGGGTGVTISTIASGVGLFAVGGITTLFTGRSIFVSGGRMLVLGLAAAAATFGIGKLVGGTTGI